MRSSETVALQAKEIQQHLTRYKNPNISQKSQEKDLKIEVHASVSEAGD
jgi:hypothetical protein